MTLSTQAKLVSDVVVSEDANRRSRESMLVDESQTLVVGTVCKPGPNGRKIILAAAVDAVQTIAITGTLTAGSYTLAFVGPTGTIINTGLIAYNASLANVNTALDAALGSSQVVATGTVHTAMVMTFSGSLYAGRPQAMIDLDASDLTGMEDSDIAQTTVGGQGEQAAVDAVQTVTITGATAGTFTITAKNLSGVAKTTGTIAYDATTGTIATALNDAAVLGADGCAVTGTDATSFIVTFDGAAYTGRPQDPITLDLALMTGVTASSVAQTTLGHPATDGGADSICLEAVTTAGGAKTTQAAFLVRSARVNQDQLAFGSGNANLAITALARREIVMAREPFDQETL